jgi:hypothetical protein
MEMEHFSATGTDFGIWRAFWDVVEARDIERVERSVTPDGNPY